MTSREDRRLTFTAHYTLSKSIDPASDPSPSMFRALGLGPVSESNARAERGLSDFDRRHRLVAFFLWRLPALNNASPALRIVAGDWNLSGVVTLQSGPYISAYSGGDFFGGRGDFNRDGVLNDRLVYSGKGAPVNRSSPADGYFNTSLFTPPADGVVPARNLLPAPGLASIDLSLRKRIHLGDRNQIDLVSEVFNVTNRANFAAPETDFASAGFGRSHQAFSPRTIRFAVRYSF